jgi:membrane protease YdiL (CAAX protease family)
MSTRDQQALASDSGRRADELYRLSLTHPILVPFALLFIAVIFRIVDVFLLGLAEALGEAFLHKALGFVLVLVYLWAVGQSLGVIGLHGRLAGKAMFIGASGMALIFIVGFGLQLTLLRAAGRQPALVVAAIDPQTGLTGGLAFALLLLVGNLVNSLMEEGLFRGVMLTHFRVRLSPWQANLLQAVVFGLWHLAWPVKRLVAGQTDLATAASQATVIVLGSTISGLVYGYLYLKTDSLWAPWLAHTINNSTFNLLHIRTIEGLDADIGALYGLVAIGYAVLLLWTKLWAERLQMPELRPWEGNE